VDLHADTIFHALTAGRTIAGAAGKGDLDVARMKAGGYAAQFFAIWVPAKVDAEGPGASVAWAERAYAAYEKLLAGAGPEVERAVTAADVERIRAAGRVAAVLSIEGAHALGDRPEAIDAWAARGLRLLGLAWNNSNAFAEAAADPRPAAPGLTAAGRALVARAEGLGILLDVSHASKATFWDLAKMARRPIVASHSDCAALRKIPRNLDDDQLRAIAASGGLVGINFHAPFVSKKKPVTIAHVVEHVLHAVKVAGPEHVGLGSDFDGLITKPVGLERRVR
jgi:membrane dipeptidase